MVGVLVAVLLVVLLAGLLAWTVQVPATARARTWELQPPPPARWAAAHDEVDGVTRVLLRRTRPGSDGRPEVLEERVFDSFPAHDPAWEVRFTEGMAGARFRCSYLDREERQG